MCRFFKNYNKNIFLIKKKETRNDYSLSNYKPSYLHDSLIMFTNQHPLPSHSGPRVVDTTRSPTTYRPRRPFWTSSLCCLTARRSSTPSWATARSGRTSSPRCSAQSPRVASRSSTASSRTTEKSMSPRPPVNVWEIPLFGVYMSEEFYRLILKT